MLRRILRIGSILPRWSRAQTPLASLTPRLPASTAAFTVSASDGTAQTTITAERETLAPGCLDCRCGSVFLSTGLRHRAVHETAGHTCQEPCFLLAPAAGIRAMAKRYFC